MKTKVTKLLLMAVLCLCFSNYLKAQKIDTSFFHQINYTFGNLDKSKVPFGILKDFGMEFANLQYYDGANMADSTAMNKSIFLDIYKTLFSARVTLASGSTMPDPGATDSLWYIKTKPGLIPLGGLFYQYAYLDKNAYTNNTITVTGTQLFDKYIGGVWQNPYISTNAVGFAPATDVYMGKSFNIILPDSLWLSNSKNMVDHIELDLADGLGYRTITPSTPLLVNYADTGLKVWNFKLFLTNSTVLQSHTKIQINADEYHQNDLPTTGGFQTNVVVPIGTPPPGSPPSFFHVITSETYQGANAYGFVTVQYAPGHTGIIKPFIVAEGFDPGIITNPANPVGEYSLHQFKTFLNYPGSTINSLISNNYDIVFIDYRNGTDDIHRNALVVKEVIRWVNQQKALNGSTEHNVIMGQSMGGPLVRYALKTMENAGETHDVRLFISHDGAQQGANVPTGFQYMINHIDNSIVKLGLANVFTGFVKLFAGGVFILKQTPAAQQLIMNYITAGSYSNNSVHTAWQTELTNLGYPSQGGIRNIAISNGSECGQAADVAPNGILLKYDGTNQFGIGGNLIDFGLGVLSLFSGHPRWSGLLLSDTKYSTHFQVNASATNGGMQVYHGDVGYSKHIFFFNINGTLTDDTENGPSGLLAYDSFGGSYFPVDAQSYIPTAGATLIGPYHFCAIPTPSALDIGANSANLSPSDYTVSYSPGNPPVSPKNTPFANFITAYNGDPSNEQHITFENRNGNWLADELNGISNIASCSFICNNALIGPTNFCTSATYQVSGLPSSATVSWTYTGGITGPATGNPVTVTATGGGEATIKASIHSNCTTTDFALPTLNIFTGPPYLSSKTYNSPTSRFQSLTSTYLGDISPASYNPTCSSAHTSITVPLGTTVTWALASSPTAATWFQSSNNLFLSFTAPGQTATFSLTISNSCGSFTWYYNFKAVSAGCGNYPQPAAIGQPIALSTNDDAAAPSTTASPSNIQVTATAQAENVEPQPGYYPNPANGSITLTIRANPNAAPGTVPFSYKIYDQKGKIWSRGGSPTGADITLSTAGMPSDEYFLHLTVNGKTIKKHLIIQH